MTSIQPIKSVSQSNRQGLLNAGIGKLLLASKLSNPPPGMILNGPNTDKNQKMQQQILSRLSRNPFVRVIPIIDLTPDDVANAKTMFYVRKTDANYGNTKFEVNDPHISNPPWWHKGKATITMDIMDMARVPDFNTYEQIIRYATQHTSSVSGTHFVINAANMNEAIKQFTLYANENPTFHQDVQVSDIYNKIRQMQQQQMEAGTRKRNSKISSKKLRHKSKRKSQKRKFSRKMI